MSVGRPPTRLETDMQRHRFATILLGTASNGHALLMQMNDTSAKQPTPKQGRYYSKVVEWNIPQREGTGRKPW